MKIVVIMKRNITEYFEQLSKITNALSSQSFSKKSGSLINSNENRPLLHYFQHLQ